jgi:hypothetical protein
MHEVCRQVYQSTEPIIYICYFRDDLLNSFAYHKINDVVYGLDSRGFLQSKTQVSLSLSLSLS